MLNAFPQGSSDPDILVASIERATADLAAQAIVEAAQRFTGGLVDGQNKTFAPSVAEFATEARRINELLPFRGRQALPAPKREFYQEPKPSERVRMGFKLAVWRHSLDLPNGADAVAEANRRGLEYLIVLGQQWGVPVPDELFDQLKSAA